MTCCSIVERWSNVAKCIISIYKELLPLDTQERACKRGPAREGAQERACKRGRAREGLQERACKRGRAREGLQERACKRGPAREGLQERACKRGPAREDVQERIDMHAGKKVRERMLLSYLRLSTQGQGGLGGPNFGNYYSDYFVKPPPP